MLILNIERGHKVMVFKSILASLGMGATKIDLVLTTDQIEMGQQVDGKIIMTGGDVEQRIEGLFVDFTLNSRFSRDDHTIFVNEVIKRITIFKDDFMVKPRQLQEFPFSFQCPEYLPVSSVNTRYYFQTNLEIKSGIDSKDRDFIIVKPSGLIKNFLEGFTRLGFAHHAEGYTGKQRDDRQIIQFQPTTWLRGKFDEIVFSYQPGQSQHQISGFFELDKRTHGVLGMLADEMDLDERKGYYQFSASQLATPEIAAETIRHFIIENSKGLYGW